MPERISKGVFKNQIAGDKHKCQFAPVTKRVANGYVVLHVCKICGHSKPKGEPSKFNEVLRKEIGK